MIFIYVNGKLVVSHGDSVKTHKYGVMMRNNGCDVHEVRVDHLVNFVAPVNYADFDVVLTNAMVKQGFGHLIG